MSLTQEDTKDIRSVLNEQFDLINPDLLDFDKWDKTT
jgi:hypothetical protein